VKYRRFNAKRDESEPAIVEALEKAGFEVHRELPVDLLCLKRVSAEQLRRSLTMLGDGEYLLVKLLEAKTAQGKRKPKARIDKRQEKQNAFCERWNVQKPTGAIEALLAVGEVVTL
jgi:hypothetical protein